MNQVDLMTALTTTRFQTINEMKHFKETLLHESAIISSSSLSHFNNNNNHHQQQQQHRTNSFLDTMSIHDSFISFDSNHNHLHDRKNRDNNNNNYVSNATFEELKSEIFKTNFKYNLGQFEQFRLIYHHYYYFCYLV